MIPIKIPRIPADTITRNASYMKMRLPWALVTPIDLSTPYSQMLSLMFCVVATKSKKNVRIKLITPIIPTMKENTMLMVYKDLIKAYTSTMIGWLIPSGNIDLIPLMMYWRRESVMFEAYLMINFDFGIFCV